MPLIAREVIIKVTVEDTGRKGGEPPEESGKPATPNGDIISACVEKVLEILKEKSEP